MSEMYVTGRDAHVAGALQAGQVKPIGVYRAPEYTREFGQSGQPVRSPASRDAALAKLGAMFPGIVKRADS